MQAADHLSSPRPRPPRSPLVTEGSQEWCVTSINIPNRRRPPILLETQNRETITSIWNISVNTAVNHCWPSWTSLAGAALTIESPCGAELVAALNRSVERLSRRWPGKYKITTTKQTCLLHNSRAFTDNRFPLPRLNQRFSESPAQRRVERQKGARPGFTTKCS